MSKAIANLTQLAETITFSAQDNGESINVTLNELARGPAGLGVPAGGTEGQILSKATDTSYDTEWIDNFATSLSATVRNETGATLTKGTVVYINGGSGNKPTVTKASASSEATSSKTFAILSEDIDHQQNGQAITMGLLKQVNTNGMAAGANLWLSTTPGVYTTTMPTAPDNAVFLGNVVRVSSTVGEIEVRIQNGYELGELHNVSVAGAVGGDTLRYDSDAGLWRHESPTSDSQPNTIVARNVSGQFEASGITFVNAGDTSYGNSLLSDHDGSVEPTPVFSNYLPLGAGRLLLDAANLSDLSDFATARTNLGLGTTDSPTFKDLTIATGTITTSNPVEVTQTWNAAGVSFTGLKLNATDTASASGSLLMDLQVGGVSQFRVSKAGGITAGSINATNSGSNFASVTSSSTGVFLQSGGRLGISSTGYIGFSSSGDATGTLDTRLIQDAAQQLAQRNGTNAQTFRVYGTYANLTTDYRRVSIKMSTAGVGEIAPEGGSSTATGNMILFKPGDNIVTEAADFTLSEASHAGRYVRLTKTGSTQTITLPTTGVSTGAEFQFYRATSQTLAFSGGTVNGGSNLSTVPQNGAFALKYLGSGTYDFI